MEWRATAKEPCGQPMRNFHELRQDSLRGRQDIVRPYGFEIRRRLFLL
jgi:hypothetical protein